MRAYDNADIKRRRLAGAGADGNALRCVPAADEEDIGVAPFADFHCYQKLRGGRVCGGAQGDGGDFHRAARGRARRDIDGCQALGYGDADICAGSVERRFGNSRRAELGVVDGGEGGDAVVNGDIRRGGFAFAVEVAARRDEGVGEGEGH